MGSWPWVIWGISVRVSVSVVGHWLIGYFAHNHGERHWHVEQALVQGHNVPFVAFLTMGESYRNNHHAFPRSANFALEEEQVDIGWLVLMGLSKVGLAWHFVLPKDIPVRPELSKIKS